MTNLALMKVLGDPEPLATLSKLGAVRSDLDRTERRLIEEARARGRTWPEIASALGLRSRQAAEQRWLRLCADANRDARRAREARARQRAVDAAFGAAIAKLRDAARAALRHIDEDADWDQRHPRAVLIRTTLAVAVTADPGALYELAAHAAADLDQLSWPTLPATLAAAVRRLKHAVAAATPGR